MRSSLPRLRKCISAAIKRNELLPFETCMYLESIMLCKSKRKYYMISLTCAILKEKPKELKQIELMDIENRLSFSESGGWGWAKWVKGVKRYKFLVIK